MRYRLARSLPAGALLLALLLVLVLSGGCASVESDWKTASEAGTIEAYEDFLAKRPESSFAEEARGRIDTLAWEAASEANTIEAIEAYLAAHPEGRYVADAQERIERLRPVTGYLYVLSSMAPAFGGKANNIYLLRASPGAGIDRETDFELIMTEETVYVDFETVPGAGHVVSMGHLYEVNGEVVDEGKVVGRSIVVDRIRYVGPADG